jgi:hypothetical protein
MLPGLIALSAVLAPIALSDKSSTNQEQPNDDARIPANFMF